MLPSPSLSSCLMMSSAPASTASSSTSSWVGDLGLMVSTGSPRSWNTSHRSWRQSQWRRWFLLRPWTSAFLTMSGKSPVKHIEYPGQLVFKTVHPERMSQSGRGHYYRTLQRWSPWRTLRNPWCRCHHHQRPGRWTLPWSCCPGRRPARGGDSWLADLTSESWTNFPLVISPLGHSEIKLGNMFTLGYKAGQYVFTWI